jgi:hypothetical protein
VSGLPQLRWRSFSSTLQAARAAHDCMERGTLQVCLTMREVARDALPFSRFDDVQYEAGLSSGDRRLVAMMLDPGKAAAAP